MKRLHILLAAVGIWMVSPLPGLLADETIPLTLPPRLIPEPANLNEQGANAVADRLRQSGQLQHYCIDIAYHDGTVELTGRVASESQRDEVLKLVRGVAGVEKVVDHLAIQPANALTPVQAEAIAPPKEPPQLPRAPTPVNPAPAAVNAIVEPMPMMAGMPGGGYDLSPPKMPPYAWPTYAPYNNFSRVAIPEAYPYNAWPYIGPAHPFPKVPLGWRSVKLEWQDGYWWFRRVGTPHDWWRLRYW